MMPVTPRLAKERRDVAFYVAADDATACTERQAILIVAERSWARVTGVRNSPIRRRHKRQRRWKKWDRLRLDDDQPDWSSDDNASRSFISVLPSDSGLKDHRIVILNWLPELA